MQRFKRTIYVFPGVLLALVLVLALFASPVAAQDGLLTYWEGNGAPDGICSNIQETASVPPGYQLWLFILTSPDPNLTDAEDFDLVATFQIDGMDPFVAEPVIVEPKGNPDNGYGSVHLIVVVPQEAVLLEAYATGGVEGGNLVVSHCGITPSLDVTKTAAAYFTRQYFWTVEKRVSDDLHLFDGQSGQFDWLIEVSPNGHVDKDFYAVFNISVHNPTEYAVVLEFDDPMMVGSIDNTCVDDTPLAGYGTFDCSYRVDFETNPDTVNNEVTVSDSSGNLNPGSDTASATFTDPTSEEDTDYVLEDLLNGVDISALLSEGPAGSWTYTNYVDCDADEGNFLNVVDVYGADSGDFNDNASATADLYCYTPTIDKSAEGDYDIRHTWELLKSVDPDMVGFIGDNLPYDWTLEVVDTPNPENYVVSGTITVGNPHPSANMVAGLTDALNNGTFGDVTSCSGDDVISFDNATDTVTVAPLGSVTCDYTSAQNDASATSNEASFTLYGITYSDDDPIEWESHHVDDSVQLTDEYLGIDETITGDWQNSYPDSYDCSSETDDYLGDGWYSDSQLNEAAISMGDSVVDEADASINFTCYAPLVEKSAETSFNRYWDWTITKSVDDNDHHMFAGDPASTSNYTVTVNPDDTDNDWQVWGDITVYNPAPMDMNLTDVTDSIALFGDVDVDCDSLVVPAAVDGVNGELTCSYDTGEQNAPDDNPFGDTNTATVSFNGFNFSDDADVVFGEPASEIDETATLDDSMEGQGPGANSADSSTWTWNYSADFDCSAVTAEQYGEDGTWTWEVPNEATVTEGDTGESDSDDESVTITCYIPLVEKSAETSFNRYWDWTITKSVDENDHHMFAGDPASTSNYTVTVNPDDTDNDWQVWGDITVYNPAPMDMSLTDVTDSIALFGDVDVDCDSLVVPAAVDGVNGELTCSYDTGAQNAPDANPFGASNTATVSFNGSSYSDDADVVFGEPADEIDETATLDDSMEGQGPGANSADSSTWTWNYSADFDCSAVTDEQYGEDGTYSWTVPNEATVTEGDTGENDSDNESVTVTCYIPLVEKSAETSFNRYWDWTITKSVDDNDHHMFAGDPASTSNYTVTVNPDDTDNDWQVWGDITVYNPAPMDMNLTDVTDSIALFGDVDVDCDSLVVPAAVDGVNGELTCSYDTGKQNAPDDNPFGDTNTATVSFNGSSYSDDADVVFGDPADEIDETATLDDTMQGDGPSFDASSGESTWNYSADFDCSAVTDEQYGEDGTYSWTVPNEATVTEGDTGENDSDDESVTVTCYIPLVSKAAEGTYTETHIWDITKTVEGETSGFAGEVLDYEWEVNVTEEIEFSDFQSTGTITVKNPNPASDMTVSLEDTLSDGTPVTLDCGGSLNVAAATVNPDESVTPGENTCTYTIDLGYTDPADAATDNDVTATLNELGYDATDPIEWEPNIVDDEVVVTDDEIGLNETISDPPAEAWTGTDSYLCSVDTNAYVIDGEKYTDADDNRAEVSTLAGVELDYAEASIDFTCYLPSVEKFGSNSFDRDWAWDITKTSTTESLTLTYGESATIEYTVSVSASSTDSNSQVSGTIEVNNPKPDENFVGTLTDASLADGSTVVIDPASCVNGTYNAADGAISVDAGSTMTCDYSADRGDDVSSTSNTAQIEWNYDNAMSDSDSVELVPDLALGDETNECANVGDDFAAFSGGVLPALVCATQAAVDANAGAVLAPHDFNYSVTVGAGVPDVDIELLCGDNTVDNTATVTPTEGGAADEDDVSIPVSVACADTQLVPTQVDCAEFRTGTAPDLYLEVGKSGQISPGRFFYYYDLPAAVWPGSVTVHQTVSTGNDSDLHRVDGVKVFADDCSNIVKKDGVSWTDNGDGTVTITVDLATLAANGITLDNVAFRIEYGTADNVPAGTVYEWTAWGAEDETSTVYQK